MPEETPQTARKPTDPLKVFIVGSARSGTSITYMLMCRVFNLLGRGESHIMPVYQTMVDAIPDRQAEVPVNVTLQQIDAQAVRDLLRDNLVAFYNQQFPGGSWVDKSPGAYSIGTIPLIREWFPDARCIVTMRTGIEVVVSAQAKFGIDQEFLNACEAWDFGAQAILAARAAPAGTLFIDQFDMTNNTEQLAHAIATFLNRPSRAADAAAFLRTERIGKLSEHDWSRRLTLEDVPWTRQQKAMFVTICGASMKAMGYPMTR